jgi:ATP-dependent Clp protease ATP-binding subunit ClpB
VLDDGRLTDNKGRVANFKNTIIIMTSNAGAHVIQENFANLHSGNEEEIIEKTKEQVTLLLRQTIRPEFLNRIDEIVMFKPLSAKEIRKIVDIQFKIIQKRLEESGVKIEAAENALDKLAYLGYDPQFGARPLKRVMQREILNELSKEILSGKVKKDSLIGLSLDKEGNFQFINLDEVQLS